MFCQIILSFNQSVLWHFQILRIIFDKRNCFPSPTILRQDTKIWVTIQQDEKLLVITFYGVLKIVQSKYVIRIECNDFLYISYTIVKLHSDRRRQEIILQRMRELWTRVIFKNILHLLPFTITFLQNNFVFNNI